MSHSPGGVAATSASAAGASGGEQVPQTTPIYVCPSHPLGVHPSMPAGLTVCAHTSTIHVLARWCVPGLWGEPTSQTAECPVWEHGLSLLLTESGVEGGQNRKEQVSAHRAHPRSCRQLELVCGPVKYPGELGPPR